MKVKKISAIDAISFAGKSILGHVRLFFFILLAGSGLIAVVVGLVGFLNKDLIQSLMSSPMFQNFQECIGSNCFTVVYQSGVPIIEIVRINFIPLFISTLVLALFFVGLDLGFKTIALDIYDRDGSKVDKLFSQLKAIPQGLIAWILYGIMVWIGFMFFIIPGFIALLRFAFFPFFIIDKKADAIDSLKMSYHATNGYIWDIFAFFVLVKIIVYLCFLSWIGVILTWPLSTLAYAYVYRQLVPKPDRETFTTYV